jgi:hypothetical protein
MDASCTCPIDVRSLDGCCAVADQLRRWLPTADDDLRRALTTAHMRRVPVHAMRSLPPFLLTHLSPALIGTLDGEQLWALFETNTGEVYGRRVLYT